MTEYDFIDPELPEKQSEEFQEITDAEHLLIQEPMGPPKEVDRRRERDVYGDRELGDYPEVRNRSFRLDPNSDKVERSWSDKAVHALKEVFTWGE